MRLGEVFRRAASNGGLVSAAFSLKVGERVCVPIKESFSSC